MRNLTRPSARRARRRGLAALLTTGVLLGLAPAAGVPEDRPVPRAAGKGPVGWDVYRDLGRVDELRRGGQARQSASYDRAGGNDDGFDGTYSCLRETADGCVIAEDDGAGEIQSMWFTRHSNGVAGDVSDTGDIRVELDGTTVLDAPLQEVVSGEHGAPFVWPLVGNADDTAGGALIKVPMPYRESMRVTVDHNPLFHHVTYRSFADAEGVTRFDPTDPARDVLRTLRRFGVADPKPPRAGARTERADLDVPAGDRATVAELHGAGEISQLRLRLPQVLRSPGYRDDGRAFGEGGSSTFQVAVDPDNTGVRLTRRVDPRVGDQTSRVLVDGEPVGQWRTGTARGEGHWADVSLTIPATLARGKEQLTVTHEFVSSDDHVNEFRYDVHSRVDGDWTRTDVLDLGPAHPGEESAHGYRVKGETWHGTRTSRYPTSERERRRLRRSDALLADARLRITFDGRRTVDAPLGEFFGSGLGEYDVRSLMFAMDTAPDGWYTAWWPMPYMRHATVEIVNGSGHAIEGATAEVTHAPRRAMDAHTGYFHATSREGRTVPGRDWPLLDTGGRGVFYGVTHSMRGLITDGNRRNYLEGDERVHVDGELTPSMYGTGTEDYYESGWYFRDGTTFTMPLVGNPAYEKDGDGCAHDCTGAYRLHVGDAVSFGRSLRFGIEHGPASHEPGDYSSTAYWYGRDTAAVRHSDTLPLDDPDALDSHAYTASGATTTDLTATFEGEYDDVRVTGPVTAATGKVSFRMAVDPRNTGVRLTRLADQAKGYQRAEVRVDGERAGVWSTTLGNTTARWRHDRFELPAALTHGKSSLTITLTPLEGSPPWSAARYEALSHVAPFTDDSAPRAVTGVTVHGDGTNALTVQWAPAADNVGARAYRLYGSTDPSVPLGKDTLLARTPHPAFRHEGLGLAETWHYRVVAVDGAGNVGAPSAPVSGTTGEALVHEAEDLLPPVRADAPVERQPNCCGVVWSGDAQAWFRATGADQRFTVEFSVPRDGSYDLAAVLTRAGDYGDVTFAVDGNRVGDTFHGHAAEVGTTDWVDLGSRTLSRGTHQLTLTVVGKAPEAEGYLVGLDRLRFTRTG